MLKKLIYSPLVEQFIYSAQSFLSLLLITNIFNNKDFGVYNVIIFASLLFANVMISATFLPMVPLRNKIKENQVVIYDEMVTSFVMLVGIISIIITFIILSRQGFELVTAILLSLLLTLRASFEYLRRYNLIIGNCKQSSLVSLSLLVVLLGLFCYSKFYDIRVSIILYMIFVLPIYLIPQIKLVARSLNITRLLMNKEYFELINAHFHESKWLVMTSFTQIFSSNYFLIALASQLGPFQLGAFRVIQNITNVFNPLISFSDNNVFVSACEVKKNKGDYGHYIFSRYLKLLLFIFIPLIIISIFSDEIITYFYGFEISKFSYILPVFSLSVIVVITGTFFRLYLRVESINHSSFWVNIFISLLAFIFAPMVIREFGILGAAFGVLLTQLLFFGGIFMHYVIVNGIQNEK